MKKRDKKGAMELSFGMIFSIILIIAFVAFAFWGIKKFIELQRVSEMGGFVQSLQEDVDRVWKSSQSSEPKTYSLPGKIEKVCLSSNSEIYFLPMGSGGNFDYTPLNHINIANPEATRNDFCINNVNGKVSLVLKKDFGENLVTLSRG